MKAMDNYTEFSMKHLDILRKEPRLYSFVIENGEIFKEEERLKKEILKELHIK